MDGRTSYNLVEFELQKKHMNFDQRFNKIKAIDSNTA